jgi:tripartite-type tricarboxylate transporter receptor subunit TctC
LFAPANLPKPIIDLAVEGTRKVMADPDFQRILQTSGFEPMTDSGPEHAQRLVSDELARWTPIMKATNFKLE